MSSRQQTTSKPSSRTTSPAPVNTQQIDPYRVISSHVKKPLAPLLPHVEPLLADLLSLDSNTYSARLSGKTLLTTPDAPSAMPSALVQGRKRNRGNPSERKKAREEHEYSERQRQELGLAGMRSVKRRLGSVIDRGQRVSYDAMLPLHHLHVMYIITLLALPRLPSPVPTTLPNINPEPLQSKISKADFTGIQLRVKAAKNKSLVGLEGLVIEETAETFRLVGKDDKVRVIPKQGSLFRLSFPAYAPSPPSPTPNDDIPLPYPQDLSHHLRVCPRMELDLLGSSFGYRSVDRAGRKFRPAQGGGGGSGWGEEWIGSVGEMGSMLDGVERSIGSCSVDKIKTENEGKRKRGKSRRKDPAAWGNW